MASTPLSAFLPSLLFAITTRLVSVVIHNLISTELIFFTGNYAGEYSKVKQPGNKATVAMTEDGVVGL